MRRAQIRPAVSSNGSTLPANKDIGPSGPASQRSNSLRFFPLGFSRREPPCQRSDQLAIGFEPKNLEPGHPALVEPLPVTLQCSFLRRGAQTVD
jgi:hypothetical protein